MLGKSVFQSAKILRDKFVLEREDGSKVYLSFFDSDHTKNIFQVTHQTTVVGKYVNRYDVTILVNGLPLIQVELKRRGIDIREAVNQVMRYKKHSYNGLYHFIQMPVIIREMSDDEAVIAMVDANLQREHILPSEKAFAYKIKLEAIKHQGITSRQVGEKLLSVTQVSKESDDSERQVQRYIRLTYLIPELLEMVDDGKIAFNPAVEISYLEQSEQRVLLNAMELNDCTPSHAQSIRLKKLSQEGVLQDQTIYDILAEQKPNQQEQYKFKREDIRKYFPQSYTDKQVCDTVIKLLEQWQRRRERDRDSR